MRLLQDIKLYIIFFFSIAILSCQSQDQKDVVFEDFESTSFDNWELQGTAFNKPYLADTISNSKLKESIQQSYFAYSCINDKKLNQGKLISKEFTIKHQFIDFRIGGGDHKTRTCINLLINNKIVRTKSGNNDKILRYASWNVSEFIGQKAIIEIVDAQHSSPNGIAQIMIDEIIFSNHLPQPTIIFEDFESGNFKHWTVEGEAFNDPGNRKNIYYPVTVNGFQGKYFAFSFGENHDIEKGRLISEPFKIKRNYIKFLVGGGNHSDTTCIQLWINNKVVQSATGLHTGELREEFWNVSSLIGQNAHIEILDNYSGFWGHIIIDNIRFSDELNDTNAEIIHYHNPPKHSLFIIGIILVGIMIAAYFFFQRRKPINKKSNALISKKEFQKQLLALIEEEKIYLNKNLTSKQVANILNLNNSDFLEKTKITFKKSFNDLMNEYRVNFFKKEVLKEENRGLKLVAISEKCGFSSKSSFYRIFKTHTNETPTEYLVKLNNNTKS